MHDRTIDRVAEQCSADALSAPDAATAASHFLSGSGDSNQPPVDCIDTLAGLMRANASQNSWSRSPLKLFDGMQLKDAQSAAYGCVGLVAILRADSTGAGLVDDAEAPYEPFSPRLRDQLFSALALLTDYTFGCLDRVREGFEFPPADATSEPNRHG